MRPVLVCALALLLMPRASAAQDTPRVGLVIGFPAGVGVAIRVSDRVAIRPAISASRTSTEITTTTTTFAPGFPPRLVTTTQTDTATAWTATADVSALLYFGPVDAFRTYVSPRIAYTHSSSTSPSVNFDFSNGVTTTTQTSSASAYEFSGAFGAQYALGRRFGVFGEVGPRFRRSSTSRTDGRSWLAAITSGVGVIVYFGS